MQKFETLSASEVIVLKAVWDAGKDISVPDLTQVLLERYGKEYARTTVVTFIVRIKAKGYVSTYRKGKLSYVHALIKEDDYKIYIAQKNTDMWFKGLASNFLVSLFDNRKMSKEEINRIQSMLDDFKKEEEQENEL